MFHISQCVAQHQAAFGIGVQVFDGGAVHGAHHVARLGRARIGHVFASGHHHGQVNRQLGFHGGDKRADHGGRAAHVVFHFVHAFAGFQRNAAAVEREPFAHQHDGVGRFVRRAEILELQQFGLFFAAFGHTPEGGHIFADVIAAEDFGGRTQLLRFFGGGFGQIGRRADVGAGVGQIFAQVHAV